MPETPTLLPCPCCGATPELFTSSPSRPLMGGNGSEWNATRYEIHCRCGLQTDWMRHPSECAERWNARVAPADVLQRAARDLRETARDCLARLGEAEKET